MKYVQVVMGPLHLTTANANGVVDIDIKHTHVEINGHLEIANGTTSVNKHSVGIGNYNNSR